VLGLDSRIGFVGSSELDFEGNSERWDFEGNSETGV